ncbi:methionine synthase [bacterium]|nr:methionine synthase [bacterium]
MSNAATILTTVVGSYPTPSWLSANPSADNIAKATEQVLEVQQQAGLDLVCDGEMYRFDPNHPETNGMIEYFIRPMEGIRMQLTDEEIKAFRALPGMEFRRLPSGIVDGKLGAGSLDLKSACDRVLGLAKAPVKFTLTGPHMLAKTIPNKYYKDKEAVAIAIAEALAPEIAKLDAEVVQLDEANLTGHPGEWRWALEAINIMLDAVKNKPAVHLCFGNYGGKRVQQGHWANLIDYLNGLHADHLVLETKRRPADEFEVFKELRPEIGLGLGVVDIKSNVVESAEEIARDLEHKEKVLGSGRIKYIHPDCGFWMLDKVTTDAKIRALVAGRNLYEGR